jgi:hypothetical protein
MCFVLSCAFFKKSEIHSSSLFLKKMLIAFFFSSFFDFGLIHFKRNKMHLLISRKQKVLKRKKQFL